MIGNFIVARQGIAREATHPISQFEMLNGIRFDLEHPDEADALRKARSGKVLVQYTWKQTRPKILAPMTRVDG